MRKTAIKMLICSFILLSLWGCRYSSSGEYYLETEHESSDGMLINTIDEIKNYYDLRTAVTNSIKYRREAETFVISQYNGDLQSDLKLLSDEIATKLPLGLYAIASFKYEERSIMSKHEVYISIEYSLDEAQMAQIVKVDRNETFESNLSDMFELYQTEKAFSFRNFTDENDEFEKRVLKSWFRAGESAMPVKAVSISYFPDSGEQRIVEIKAEYEQNKTELEVKKDKIHRFVENVCRGQLNSPIDKKIHFIYDYLGENVYKDEKMRAQPLDILGLTGADTAYGALLGRSATDIGRVMAANAMCHGLNIKSEVIYGQKDMNPYAWLYLRENDWVFDVLAEKHACLITAEKAREMFQWDEIIYNFE